MGTMQFRDGRQTWFSGRNGLFLCSGIRAIYQEDAKTFVVQPLTSKGVPGRCFIEIPADELDAVIQTMKTARR